MPAASNNVGSGSGGVGTGTIAVTLTGAFTNGGSTSISLPSSVNANSPLASYLQDMASGANTITISSKASCLVIVPPAGNVATMTLKGVGGDTGISIGLLAPQVLQFPSTPPASVVLNISAAVTGFQIIQY